MQLVSAKGFGCGWGGIVSLINSRSLSVSDMLLPSPFPYAPGTGLELPRGGTNSDKTVPAEGDNETVNYDAATDCSLAIKCLAFAVIQGNWPWRSPGGRDGSGRGDSVILRKSRNGWWCGLGVISAREEK